MKKLLVFFSLILVVNISFSQDNLPKFKSSVLINQYLGYNFFIGNDAKMFKTVPKAFGSGINDFSGVYSIYNFWIFKPIKRNIGLLTTIAIDITKYRFEDNLLFDTNNDLVFADTVSSHQYNPDFFSLEGTKLVIGKLYIPLIVYLPVSHWFKKYNEDFGIFGGIVYRPYLFSYHKQFYTENDRTISVTTPNNLISKYFSKNNLTVKAGIKINNLVLFGQ